MDGDSQKDHATIDLHGALCRLVTPSEWRTMIAEGRLCIIGTQYGHIIGALPDHSLIAVPQNLRMTSERSITRGARSVSPLNAQEY